MKDKNSKILKLIEESSIEINEDNLGIYQKELQRLIHIILSKNSNKVFHSIKDRRSRFVIISDIHCDLCSLVEILRKLMTSKYDYFEKGYFIFLGDYIDRGQLPLQVLILLLRLKLVLGDRCILLKGNHDNFEYKDGKFFSKVHPAETIELLVKHLKVNSIKKLKLFFDSLPYFVDLQKGKKRYFLVHGGITPDKYLDKFNIRKFSKLKLPILLGVEENRVYKDILESLLWGDPVNTKFKMNNNETRFEFGYEQFNTFIKNNKFTNVIRGHEPVTNGFKSMFENKIHTVSSSGGMMNENSGYKDSVPHPAFVIINEEGNLTPEHIFAQRINLFVGSTGMLKRRDIQTYYVDNKDFFPYTYIIGTNIKVDEVDTEKSNLLKIYQNNLYVNDEFVVTIELPLRLSTSIKKNKHVLRIISAFLKYLYYDTTKSSKA